MLILALDGALGPLTAALLDDDSGEAWLEAAAPRDALEDGLRAVDHVLRAAGRHLREVERLAVTVGPGGFTGLRIALTFAKSLAFALDVPLIGISSYDALTPMSLAVPSLVAVRGRAGAACVRLRLEGGEERRCDEVDALAAWVQARVGSRKLSAAGALDELAPALQRAGVSFRKVQDATEPAVRAARLAGIAVPSVGVHGVQPDYGERPHTTVPR